MAEKKKNASRTAGYIIIGLAAVGLLGFGTGGFGTNIDSIGSVDGRDVSYRAYQETLRQQIARVEQQFGQPISFPQAQALGLDAAARQQVIARTALEAEAAERGLSVGDANIRDQIVEGGTFSGPGGFDRDFYREALRRAGLTEAEYEASLRAESAAALLRAAVTGGTPEATTYGEAIAAYLGETRDLLWVTLTEQDLAEPIPDPTDAELSAWFDENADTLAEPEKKRITYAWITPDMIVDTVEVDEARLRELYDERIAEYVQPERRIVERLIFPSEEAAQTAADAIAAGDSDFEAAVSDRGLTLADVDMGDVTATTLGSAADPVFAAETGDIVGPVETPLGPALFRVNATLDARETSFEDARADLREELAYARARRLLDDAEAQIDDLLIGGATLEEVASETDLTLGTIDYDPSVSDDIAAYDTFRDAAAAVTADDFPEPVRMSDGGLFALRLDETIPPRTPNLSEVREEAIAAWQTDQLRSALGARATEIATALASGEDTVLADLDVTRQEGQSRQGFIDGTPPEFLTTAFETDPGDTAILPDGDRTVVLRVEGITPADLTGDESAARLAALAQQGTQAISDDIFEYFTTSIVTSADININEAAVGAVHANFSANVR
ncbi:peptidyl-prolyl cis-trans isomerase [Aestuariibius sp. 2305UL40-4]|uniref:peptidylprolyl isomerase n=1 Tax=Aestuariibius violaceus TaxID=3234132 RepID=UPI00345ECD06